MLERVEKDARRAFENRKRREAEQRMFMSGAREFVAELPWCGLCNDRPAVGVLAEERPGTETGWVAVGYCDKCRDEVDDVEFDDPGSTVNELDGNATDPRAAVLAAEASASTSTPDADAQQRIYLTRRHAP
jgi:hypothetical protein